MQPTIKLLLGVHAHQPVGNFPEVIHDAHLRCYRPFLHTLYEYPQFRFAVHFSGWLLEFLFQHHPNDIAMLREMVQRGQVEIFGGGDTEHPIERAKDLASMVLPTPGTSSISR